MFNGLIKTKVFYCENRNFMKKYIEFVIFTENVIETYFYRSMSIN